MTMHDSSASVPMELGSIRKAIHAPRSVRTVLAGVGPLVASMGVLTLTNAKKRSISAAVISPSASTIVATTFASAYTMNRC